MVITVEPGVYFIAALLQDALRDAARAPYLNKERIEEFADFGGVRLEDDVVITADGCTVLTNVPRTVDDVEYVMKGGEWPRGTKKK